MEKRLLSKLLSQIKHGTLSITFWDGTTENFGNGHPKASLKINSSSLLRKALKNTSLVLGEAYMNGDIEVEDLSKLIELAQLNPLQLSAGSKLNQLRHLNQNKKPKQAKFIAHHYDVGNDFYKLWLDDTMMYSCAYFKSPEDSLHQAQIQKTQHLLRKLQLEPGMELLDIGSGWGYLMVEAAKKYKIKGLGVSLSQSQVKYSNELAKREGVDDLVEFQYLNYQDIPVARVFDRIISVGFYEHVGHDNLNDYFKAVNAHLKPGCISVLHSITHQDQSPTDPWVDKYIFPGGYIPSIPETVKLMSDSGFYIFDYENLGQHYGMTIEQWLWQYEKNKSKVIAMYDESFYRMWQLYLLGAMTTFKTGSASLSQWVFKKGQDPNWPLTRAYLYQDD